MKTYSRRLLFTHVLIPLAALGPTALVAAGAGLTLARHGQTRYTIVMAPNASATVQHAAHELSADLQTISTAQFTVASAPPAGPAIYVGPGTALHKAFPKLRLRALPAEGFFIRTSGKNVALVGRDDRGTLYAVYTFLEEHLGVRWYSPHDTVIPHRAVVRIPALRERQVPAFAYRDTYEYLSSWHPQWEAHLRLDGVTGMDVPFLGGINGMSNPAENFYDLVPPSKYFTQHPDYYSLINGKRSDSYVPPSQLSLVNPDVFRIVTAALVAEAKANPHLLVLGLGPNDSPDGNSQGERSRASDAHFGAPSGTLLHFVNNVAAAIQRRFPHRKIWVETIAYHYTEKPPLPGTIKVGPHVLVMFAPIEMDFATGITAPQNRTELRHLLGWEKVASGHLQVWDYVADFSNFLQPFPDWDELGADMEFYHQHGVTGMFCQGDIRSKIGDMEAMRTWVMAHLMWNPRQSVWRLVGEFSDGYYGPAGKYIYRYLRMLRDQFRRPDMRLGLFDRRFPMAKQPYLTPKVLKKASRFFQEAESAVRFDAAYLRRVREAYSGVRYVWLMQNVPSTKSTAAERAAFLHRLGRFVRDIPAQHYGRVTIQGRLLPGWAAAMRRSVTR